MYEYEIELHLASVKPTLDLRKKENIIRVAESEYNRRSVHMQNSKKISIIKIEATYIVMTLVSALSLNSVGRALRTFSSILLKEYEDVDFMKEVTTSGALFKAVQVDESSKTKRDEKISSEEISDLDLIKGLMDYVYKKRDPDSTQYRKKRIAMEEIKRICLESGIIS